MGIFYSFFVILIMKIVSDGIRTNDSWVELSTTDLYDLLLRGHKRILTLPQQELTIAHCIT